MSGTEDQEPKENGNGKKSLVKSLLADSDSTVKLLTLVLVVFTGGSNFWATKDVGANNTAELDRAIQEVHAIHAVLDSTIQRQKEIHDMVEDILNPSNARAREVDKAVGEIHELHDSLVKKP